LSTNGLKSHILATLGVFLLGVCLLGGCKKTDPGYGSYNVGVCTPDHLFIVASTVEFTADTFSIVAEADGPANASAVNPPWVFQFQSAGGDGMRHYKSEVNEHVDYLEVWVKSGELFATFQSGDRHASVHGKPGKAETLANDGRALYTECTGDKSN